MLSPDGRVGRDPEVAGGIRSSLLPDGINQEQDQVQTLVRIRKTGSFPRVWTIVFQIQFQIKV